VTVPGFTRKPIENKGARATQHHWKESEGWSMTMTYENHAAADLFPMMTPPELKDLADDIQANGLLEPIVLLGGKVLDGRNRLAACEVAGVEPRFETWSGSSPTAYVLSKNLHRRHLSVSQLGVIGMKATPMFREEAKERQSLAGGVDPHQRHSEKSLGVERQQAIKPIENKGRSSEKAAEMVGVSHPMEPRRDRAGLDKIAIAGVGGTWTTSRCHRRGLGG
jgi:hypothetical protein